MHANPQSNEKNILKKVNTLKHLSVVLSFYSYLLAFSFSIIYSLSELFFWIFSSGSSISMFLDIFLCSCFYKCILQISIKVIILCKITWNYYLF